MSLIDGYIFMAGLVTGMSLRYQLSRPPCHAGDALLVAVCLGLVWPVTVSYYALKGAR